MEMSRNSLCSDVRSTVAACILRKCCRATKGLNILTHTYEYFFSVPMLPIASFPNTCSAERSFKFWCLIRQSAGRITPGSYCSPRRTRIF